MSGFVTAIVAISVAVVSEGVNIYEQEKAASAQKKAQQEMLDAMNRPLPTTDPSAALEDAQKAADQRRTSILATGGKTDITAGGGQLQSGDVKAKTLLGS